MKNEKIPYKIYLNPSPLIRAYCLEEKLGTPAKIYYKFEGNNTSGSHKLNSAIAQAYYAKKQGLTEATSVKQTEVFEAAEYFARAERILPAPENSTMAIWTITFHRMRNWLFIATNFP